MKSIKGTKADILDGTPEKLGDLLYHEGPLLSLFSKSGEPNAYYLYKWSDCDESANRWLVARLTSTELRSFFDQEISLRNILLANSKLFLVDVGDDLAESNVRSCSADKVPDSYLPGKNSMFVEEAFTDFAADFRLHLTGMEKRKVAKLV